MKHRTENWQLVAGIFDQFLAAAVLTGTWRFDIHPGRSLLLALLLVPSWVQIHRYFGLYDSHRLNGWRSVAANVLTASTVGFILTSILLFVTGLPHLFVALGEFTLIWLAALLTSRAIVYTVLQGVRKRGVDRRYVCVIGSWETAAQMAAQFQSRPEWGLKISTVGIGPAAERKFFQFPDTAVAGNASAPEGLVIGTDLEQVLRTEVIDEILIISRPEDVPLERYAVDFSRKYGIQCRIRVLGEELESTHVEYVNGHVTWTVHDAQMDAMGLWVKRAVDIILSGTLLILLSPLFLLLATFVKLSSPGPVFFRQVRVGLRGRKFVLIKFRTMVDGAESMLHLVAHRNITGGPIFKDTRDLRVTDIGRILRRFSLDELPQLFNVFKGDMSLVGPRPLPVHESSAIEGTFRRRFNMRPGITCRWQVQGRNNIGFVRWMELDVEYVDNWSLREDVKLLLLTIPAVFSGRGAY